MFFFFLFPESGQASFFIISHTENHSSKYIKSDTKNTYSTTAMSEFVQQGRRNNKKSGNNGQRNKQQHQQSANNPRSTFILKC